MSGALGCRLLSDGLCDGKAAARNQLPRALRKPLTFGGQPSGDPQPTPAASHGENKSNQGGQIEQFVQQ
jgi:hypothetical protein